MVGKVVMIGAGPGPADLLTVRAVEKLRAAEVVFHDDLVSADVLALCAPSAQIVNVGKRCGKRGAAQEQINALMIHFARKGLAVARLKSGDPAVFGRLGEELKALREAEIPFEIVPGITAVAAAAAAAEITLTDRRIASALVVLTAHTAGDQPKPRAIPEVDRTTFAVYMPGPDYSRTARALMEQGIDSATPCTVVSNAGRSNEQVRHLLLRDLGSTKGIVAPAVLIVGRVAERFEVPSGARDPYRLNESRPPVQIPADVASA